MIPLIELEDHAELREGDTATGVNRVDHTTDEVVTVIRFDAERIALLLEGVTNAWVENRHVLFATISTPERIAVNGGTAVGVGQPRAAFHHHDLVDDAEDGFNSRRDFETRHFPFFEGVNPLNGEVEIVGVLNGGNQFLGKLASDKDGRVDTREGVAEVLVSFSHLFATFIGNSAEVAPVVSRVDRGSESIDGCRRSGNKAIDNSVPEVNLTTEEVGLARFRVLLGEELEVPEVAVFVASTDTVGVLSIEAEDEVFKFWQGIDARHFTRKSDLFVTVVNRIVLDVRALVETKRVLVFLDDELDALTKLQVREKLVRFDNRLPSKERAGSGQVHLQFRFIVDTSGNEFANERSLNGEVEHSLGGRSAGSSDRRLGIGFPITNSSHKILSVKVC